MKTCCKAVNVLNIIFSDTWDYKVHKPTAVIISVSTMPSKNLRTFHSIFAVFMHMFRFFHVFDDNCSLTAEVRLLLRYYRGHILQEKLLKAVLKIIQRSNLCYILVLCNQTLLSWSKPRKSNAGKTATGTQPPQAPSHTSMSGELPSATRGLG